MKIRSLLSVAALVAVAPFLITAPASAAVTFDPATGTGFVGKGDVQLALGWNNKQLQDNAGTVSFTYSRTEVASTTWTCDRDAGPQTQERHNTTTTTTQGVVSTIARLKNQITGFNLTGFSEDSSTVTEHEGNPVGSCPTNWTAIDLVAGEPEVTSSGLFVNGVQIQ